MEFKMYGITSGDLSRDFIFRAPFVVAMAAFVYIELNPYKEVYSKKPSALVIYCYVTNYSKI